MSNELERAKSLVPVSRVVGQSVALHKKGYEMIGICPFHADTNASLSVNDDKGVFKCFACGAGGDQVTFIEKTRNLSAGEAIKELKKMAGMTEPESRAVAPTAKLPFQNLPKTSPTKGQLVATWNYHSLDGEVIGAVQRWHGTDGKKTFTQFRKVAEGWLAEAMPTPKPLYNLHNIGKVKKSPILIVEGEKAADAYNKQKMGLAYAVTWPGGAQAYTTVDLEPLRGRTVILWPDNDTPGISAMHGLAARLRGLGCTLKWLNPPLTEKKTDAADVPWHEIDDKQKWHSEFVTDYVTPSVEAPQPESITPTQVSGPPKKRKRKVGPNGEDFSPLGFTYERHSEHLWFYIYDTEQIIRLPMSFRQCDLIQLAPLDYWLALAPDTNEKRSNRKLDLEAIRDALHESCRGKGIFNPDAIRGTGAWADKGVLTFNAGSCLISAAGKRGGLTQHATKAVYVQQEALQYADSHEPATEDEMRQLAELIHELPFANDYDAKLLLGWILTAPICGALPWRPHIWLTGPSGTGKSWILQHVIRPLLSDACMVVQSMTTEAGIRQSMGRNALPVVMDEAEAENMNAANNIERILQLARASSSSNGGHVAKGTQGGNSQSYTTRSAFCFASIAVAASMRSDTSRITIIEMDGAKAKEQPEGWFTQFKARWTAFLTEDMIYRIQLRSLQSYSHYIANLDVFGDALKASYDMEQRDCDQLSALLSGYYSPCYNVVLTAAQAEKQVRGMHLERKDDEELDENQARTHLLTKMMRVSPANVDLSVMELHEIVQGMGSEHPTVSQIAADARLRQAGIKSTADGIWVSISMPATRDVFSGTPYARGYARVISPGQKAVTQHIMGNSKGGIKSRCVFVPLEPEPNLLTGG